MRKDFLSVLHANKGNTSNAIFHDFLDHLQNLEDVIQQFSTNDLQKWGGNDWQGFYMTLYDAIGSDSVDWNYVANPSGGVFGFWWYFKEFEFLDVLGPTDDIARFEYAKKTNRETGPAVVGIELKHRDDFEPLIQRMQEQTIVFEYLNDQPNLFQFLV